MKAKAIRNIILNILFVVICGVIAFCLARFLFTTITVEGNSMEANFHNQDKVLILKPEKNFHYGDVVVLNSGNIDPSTGEEAYYIKRIIGLPGDTLEIKEDPDGVLYVWRNGEKLVEEYIGSAMRSQMSAVTVPEGQFFYMGDNRGSSSDSRQYGCRELKYILGRVLLRYAGGWTDLDVEVVHRL